MYPFGNIAKAIEVALDGDIINIMPGTYSGSNSNTFLSNNGKSLSFIGVEGPENTILDAIDDHNVHFGFNGTPEKPPVVKIKGLSLINGSGGQGGSMDVQNIDSLFIENCIFKYNWSGGQGGAISLMNSSAYISDSRFINNQSQSAGGAIYISPSEFHELIINSTIFEDNILNMNSDGDMQASGGAIRAESVCKISNSIFNNNQMNLQTGDNAWGSGGAVSFGHGGYNFDDLLAEINNFPREVSAACQNS